MTQLSVGTNITAAPAALRWMLAAFLLWVVSMIAPGLVRGTELLPAPVGIIVMSVIAAILAAVASWVVMSSGTQGPFLSRAPIIVVATIWAGLGVFWTVMSAANVLSMWRDFPDGNTQTYAAYWPIGRAYAKDDCGGKGGCATFYYIEPELVSKDALTVDFPIAPADFEFMRTHQAAMSADPHARDINSDGYFCARAVFQRSGNALRVLDATYKHAFPAGSVTVCPRN